MTKPTSRDFELAYFGEIYDDETNDYISDEDSDFELVTRQVVGDEVEATYVTDSLEVLIVLKCKESGSLWGLQRSLPDSWHEEPWGDVKDEDIEPVELQEVVKQEYVFVE